MPFTPNITITRAIDKLSFDLACYPIFSHNPRRLAEIEFDRCSELFRKSYENELVTMNTYKSLMNRIISIEKNIQPQLQKIAIDTIKEIYNVPESINLSANFDAFDDESSDNFLDIPTQEETIEEFKGLPQSMQDKIMEEVKKRIILNTIVNGSSILIWKSAHYIAKEKIDLLHPELFNLYNKYIAFTNYILWQQNIDMIEEFFSVDNPTMFKQGKVELKKEENKISIKAEANVFPVLLMEANKGVMDYLILHGIPAEFSDDELRFYYALADNYRDEVWHNLLSPTIYSDLIEVFNTNPANFSKIIMKLCKFDYSKLEKLIIFAQSNKEEAKKVLKTILNEQS